MTTYTFRDLHRFNEKVGKRFNATAKGAVQETVREANTPGPSVGNPGGGAGGRMPKVTGFLASSIAAAIDQMPRGRTKPESFGGVIRGDAVGPTLLKWNPENETLFVGWTAVYARAMEYRYGFLRGAAQNWRRNVDRAAKDAERRIR